MHRDRKSRDVERDKQRDTSNAERQQHREMPRQATWRGKSNTSRQRETSNT